MTRYHFEIQSKDGHGGRVGECVQDDQPNDSAALASASEWFEDESLGWRDTVVVTSLATGRLVGEVSSD